MALFEVPHSNFPLHKAVNATLQGNCVVAAAITIASGHGGCARWCALRLDVKVGQPQTFSSKRIHVRRCSATDNAAAIETGLAPAEIVKKDKYDIGLVLG